MLFKNTLLFAAMQAGLAAAAGNAIISNRCDYDVYVYPIKSNQPSPGFKIPARSQHKEPFNAGDGTNTNFKVSKTDAVADGAITQLEYAVAGGQLWYDISLVDCAQGESGANCPGWEAGLSVGCSEAGCGSTHCAGGSFCPAQVYFVDQPLIKQGVNEPVFTCPGMGLGMDLTFKLCADSASIKRSIAGRMQVEVDA